MVRHSYSYNLAEYLVEDHMAISSSFQFRLQAQHCWPPQNWLDKLADLPLVDSESGSIRHKLSNDVCWLSHDVPHSSCSLRARMPPTTFVTKSQGFNSFIYHLSHRPPWQWLGPLNWLVTLPDLDIRCCSYLTVIFSSPTIKMMTMTTMTTPATRMTATVTKCDEYPKRWWEVMSTRWLVINGDSSPWHFKYIMTLTASKTG